MKVQPKHRSRNEKGNFYVLYVGLAAIIVVGWNLYASLGLSYLVSYRSKCALEAASLAAARELTRIVVDDPKWGYVALTDHPPVGDDTMANDGYPLPVTGINTILASVRLELIVAHSIGTNDAIDCALEDLASARAASRRLSRVLRNSLREKTNGSANIISSSKYAEFADEKALDVFGKEVHPMISAADIYKRNATQLLNGLGWQLDNINGELGALELEGTTNTPVPGSCDTACLDSSLKDYAEYPAFVGVPAFGEEFNFVGLGKQASLVETALFDSSRTSQNCSIIRLVAQLKKNDGSAFIKSVACAQPAYMEDKVPSAYMVLRFPDGIPSGTSTLRDLLTSEHMQNKIPLYTACGGDFPADRGAVLKENPGLATATVRQTFTRAFFDWMRTAHAKPKLDSIISALDYQFSRQRGSNTYLFTFTDDGQVDVFAPQNYPFTVQTTYESQLYTVAFNAINANGTTWTMRLRDQVHRLGKQEGGKHAGQPMPSLVAVDQNQEEAKRLLAIAGSRYDRSRLALELEISGPNTAGGGQM